MTLDQLINTIQKACLPGVWSKGVALARTSGVVKDSLGEDEVLFRVQTQDHPVSRKVSLWPQDEDWFCDCGSKQSVCVHVAAAVIVLKTSPLQGESSRSEKPRAAILSYRFTRHFGALRFDRWIVRGDGCEEVLSTSLVSLVGGVTSGRIEFFSISATKEDFSVDRALEGNQRGELDSVVLLRLMKALADCSNVLLDGQPITVSAKPLQLKVRIQEEGAGYRVQPVVEESVSESFKNGAVLCGSVLRCVDYPNLTLAEKAILSGKGQYFIGGEIGTLITEILPSLEKKVTIENQCKKFPELVHAVPKMILQMDPVENGESLSVLPILTYDEENPGGSRDVVYLPNPMAEKALARKLQNELQLIAGHRVKFYGKDAVDFVLRLGSWQTTGDGHRAFSLENSLIPSLEIEGNRFEVAFESGESKGKADAARVFKAWRENESLVPLLSGGWAPLPRDWLARYGERIQALLTQRDVSNEVPAFMLPDLAMLCEEMNQACPDSLLKLKDLLNHVEKMETAELPSDLNAKLRPYQREGVNWLCFLRNSKMGAMLSDDMGLGKTLQALCVIRGRTLIVTPTSVLYGWAQQIEQFRPSLNVSIYHGSKRTLDPKADVILTTYTMLRIDCQELIREDWNTIVLDEAQTIKNQSSQVAKAAHLLNADFKMALSGTPIENALNDLWSQFNFLNPGLLGSLDTFQDQFAFPISRGDEVALKRLQERIKPFILRRLKKDVAKDLPGRTETVLYCELDPEERDVYDSILASTRKEVIEKLEAGSSVFAALEVLLRLRQACCHAALVPGQKANRSSKIDLLIQTLEQSIAFGHRALVFSQWTSFLDLIEPALRSAGISYLRLDGSTQNRAEVIEQFQCATGPAVLLISLKAGGVGLNLTAADHIFLMDPWWNPAAEDQAADRAHRIGQRNPVLIHRLVAEKTVEERVLLLQKAKLEVARAVLEGASVTASISREDILALLT